LAAQLGVVPELHVFAEVQMDAVMNLVIGELIAFASDLYLLNGRKAFFTN